MNPKIKMHQYVIFIKPQNFDTADIWCFIILSFLFQTLFDPYFISLYNVFYTSLPVLMLGIFDQVCIKFIYIYINDMFTTVKSKDRRT